MISSIRHKQRISWTFLNDPVAISANEMLKNRTDKERFAAALSRIQAGILTLLFLRKRRRSSPSPFISHRVLEAVASWIVKSLVVWGKPAIKSLVVWGKPAIMVNKTQQVQVTQRSIFTNKTLNNRILFTCLRNSQRYETTSSMHERRKQVSNRALITS